MPEDYDFTALIGNDAPTIEARRLLRRMRRAEAQLNNAEFKMRQTAELLAATLAEFKKWRDDPDRHRYTITVKRTTDPDKPPPPHLLKSGELAAELGVPRRLWLGVPDEIDDTGRVVLVDHGEIDQLKTRLYEIEERLATR